MNIFCQYANVPKLDYSSGSYINELNFVETLSKFALVRYGELRKKFDVYYVRGNATLFNQLPNPKIWMASPFIGKCYRDADVIGAFTEVWAERIRNGNDFEWVPKEGRRSYRAVNISQAVGEQFRPLRSHPIAQDIRKKTGGDFIIGHFGRMVRSNYPTALLGILPQLEKMGIKTLFGAGKGQASALKSRNFTYKEVPFAISACDLIVLSNWGCEWEVCGSGKLLEAAACGIPVICGNSAARREFLGENYPLFHSGFNKGKSLYNKEKIRYNKNDADELLELIKTAMNKELLLKIGKDLVQRAEKHKPAELAKKLKPIFYGIAKRGI